jgi:thiol-disulfide isomerase/thioredoxin/outer membrane lipoprotein-sorting protein
MRLKRLIQVGTTFLLVAGLTALALHAQNATQPSATQSSVTDAHVTADARALLDKVRDSYANLNALDVSGNFEFAFDGGGQLKNDRAQFAGAFRSPNKFRHDVKDETTIVCNGDKLFTFQVRKNVYLTDQAPKSRADGLPDQVNALLMDQDPSLALALAPDASTLLIAGALDVSTGNALQVNGTNYPTLKIVQDDEDETVVIDPKTNLIHSVQHDQIRSVKRQGVANVKTAMLTINYTPVAVDAHPEKVVFDWTPPADAKPMVGPGVSADQEYAAHAAALEAKPAPEFTLKRLDGKSVSLGDLKGTVIVLDFWATWCPPCREGLPHIDKVAKRRSTDGVKFFAINAGDDADRIQSFIKQTGLSLPILLDSDTTTSSKYLDSDGSIPETVVIDKKGVVHKVLDLTNALDEEKVLNDEIDLALKN